VSSIALRLRLRRRRRHLALVALLLVLGGAVAVHHMAPSMSGMHQGSQTAAVAELCLAVFTAVGAAVAAAVLGFVALGRRRPMMLRVPESVPPRLRPPEPRARGGPALLVLLCVSRC